MKIVLSALLLFVSICTLQAQLVTLTGTVFDERKTPFPGVDIVVKGANARIMTHYDGKFEISTEKGKTLIFSFVGYRTEIYKVTKSEKIMITMKPSDKSLDEVITIVQDRLEVEERIFSPVSGTMDMKIRGSAGGVRMFYPTTQNTESYKEINENQFKHVQTNPLSTFSIDVDRAAYSNVRRMINNGQEVPEDAVKIEEMINYFEYDYPQPRGDSPFSINTEVVQTPWNKDTQLVRIGLQGKKVEMAKLPASNLVFLLDVSGSMNSPNKLPLLKSALKVLVNQLRANDKVSIVVYAGAAGVVLQPTDGNDKTAILDALDKLSAGGSTAGEAGIELAYKLAKEQFIDGGNNRIILATDGDFNVGASSDTAMETLIEEKRNQGIFLTCLGFGMGNYKDSKMEVLADKGNGNHAYIDSMQEAQKILGTEFGGTLYTIAKDVKIQVEFNPIYVQGHRLIGYENRLLNDEDFNDDTKDAGEIGSGHAVTALYEIVPVGVKSEFLKPIDPLKYSKDDTGSTIVGELLNVKVRYKKPEGSKSALVAQTVPTGMTKMVNASADMQFVGAVALFGMELRKSPFVRTSTSQNVIDLAEMGRGTDAAGYRAEFIRLVKASNVK